VPVSDPDVVAHLTATTGLSRNVFARVAHWVRLRAESRRQRRRVRPSTSGWQAFQVTEILHTVTDTLRLAESLRRGKMGLTGVDPTHVCSEAFASFAARLAKSDIGLERARPRGGHPPIGPRSTFTEDRLGPREAYAHPN